MNSQQHMSSPPAQDFPVVRGSLLSSLSSSYWVQSFLGQGTFGKVAKCIKTDTNEMVAVKIFKTHQYSMEDALKEVAVLQKLRSLNPDTCNIVRWNDFFIHGESMCLGFELLDMSLEDFMEQRTYQPLPLKEIRPILHQLATALKHLRTIGIIHADLKPENIMMVNHQQQPLRVKIIDFGLACDVSEARLCSYIQTRWYRSPEIMLGLSFSEAIDMWSLGQVAATLFLGTPLYPGDSEYDMLRFIVETQGQPPDHLLTLGWKTCKYFQRETNSTTGHLWRLKTPEEVERNGIQSRETRQYKFKSLGELKQFDLPSHASAANNTAEFRDRRRFVDLLKQMLQLDAKKRITPSELLEHPFISMCHLVDIYHQSTHARSCFYKMEICQKESLTSDSGKAGSKATQQPSLHQQASCSTVHHAQQSFHHQVEPAGKSRQARHHHRDTDHHPSTTTQTQSQRSVVKRKRAEPEAMETSNKSSEKQKKRGRTEDRHRNTTTGLQTSSTSQAASKSGPPKGDPNKTNEGTVLKGKRKRSAGSLASQTRKRSAPYIEHKKAANQTRCQGSCDMAQSSSSGQAAVGAPSVVRSGSKSTAASHKTGSKRARVQHNTKDNKGRDETEASRATAQINGKASMSQTGTLSPTILKWYTAFAPERVAAYKSAGPK